MKAKDVSIAVLAICLIWFGSAIVRLERYHYASMLSMCDDQADPVQRTLCLETTETRTHWVWHLAYGLRIL